MKSIFMIPIFSVSSPHPCSSVTSNGNGNIFYTAFQQIEGYDFYVSNDNGNTFGPLDPSGIDNSLGGNFTSITCNYIGDILYTAWNGQGFYQSIDYGANWINITSLLGNGEDGTNIQQVATDTTGVNIIVSTGNYVYTSTNFGNSWTSSTDMFTLIPDVKIKDVACSGDFSIKYLTYNGDIYTSVDPSNVEWTIIPGNINNTWSTFTCNSSGDKIFAVNTNNKLYYITNGRYTLLTTSPSFSSISSFSDGNNLFSYGDNSFNIFWTVT
jgi:hypothetical protein